MMMYDHQKKMGRCCEGKMLGGCCYGGEMGGSCRGREDCSEKAEGECHFWKKEKCDEESGECPMKKGDMSKKDSLKKNKYNR